MPTIEEQFSWCNVRPEIKELLLLASDNWEYTGLAEKYIREALSQAGNDLNVLVGAYRFFFYKHKPAIALSIAQKVTQAISIQEDLPQEWSELQPILLKRKQEPNIRLYLSAFAATGLVLAQLGKLEEAKNISQQVKQIDDSREFCATTVFEVINRSADEDEDE